MDDLKLGRRNLDGAQATHHLHINAVVFRALSLALHNLSVRELEIYSPRRLVTHVLEHPENLIFQLPVDVLNRICRPDDLAGSVRINLRLASRVNDRLREFREHAALLLGRPVSVAEAINACIYVMNREV